MENYLRFGFTRCSSLGTTGTVQTFALESAHPIAIGATRIAVDGVHYYYLFSYEDNLM
ncbi:hypothetical protein ACIQZI_01100 [Peribacillus sp. NPDC096379]|uniref:hypothetical protein n=1 Tax=Peribacillus sp. NPDC096379 TaxID=3364393 RepID=UPI00381B32C3